MPEQTTKKILKNNSKTFYLASLFLPKAVKKNVYTVYAYCRLYDDNVDLKNILRNKGSSFLKESLFKAISKKPKGHDFNISQSGINISSNRHMSVTGG